MNDQAFIFGVCAGSVLTMFIFFLIIAFGVPSVSNSAIEAGHAHYDSMTGERVWNSGNCRGDK